MGLADTYHIGRIVVHPRNPDIVFVAAVGHLFGPNEERGVYRSKDGGKTWQKLLYRDRDTGAEITRNDGLPKGVLGRIGVAISPANPERVWAIVEAAEGGVYRSDDGEM